MASLGYAAVVQVRAVTGVLASGLSSRRGTWGMRSGRHLAAVRVKSLLPPRRRLLCPFACSCICSCPRTALRTHPRIFPPLQARAAANGSDFMLALFYRPQKLRLVWHEERSRVLLACLAVEAEGPAQGQVCLRAWAWAGWAWKDRFAARHQTRAAG